MSLVELRIRNVAVVRDALVPLAPGFVALTGETGAGKSVCIRALRLALGGRVDADPVSAGADEAQVSAVFDDAPASVRERLAGLGIDHDHELVTLTRLVSRAGRGWSRVNGALVSQGVLREIGEALAEVTIQGASQRLLQRARQRDLLDVAAGTGDFRAAMRDAAGEWRRQRDRLEELGRLRAAGATEIEQACALADELGPLRLVPGEEVSLSGERLRLRHATALLDAAEAIRRASSGGEDNPGAADLLAAALPAALAMAGVDDDLDALAADCGRLVDQVRDLGSAARQRLDTVGVDEGRLAAVEDRLDTLARVRRRYGSVESALAALTAAQELLDVRSPSDDSATVAAAALAQAEAQLVEVAGQLSARRRAAGRRLEAAVDAALRHLELPHARFRVGLTRRPDDAGIELDGARVDWDATGADQVEFRLCANRGGEPQPLDAGPSGGELSRLVLALAACVSEQGSPLLVLDEVDTGIGGETAARVGDLLAATGRQRQVLAVTHRAEIASRADVHLLVRKRDGGGGGATATVTTMEGAERDAEIARLMSGRVTEAALARAVELRGEAVATVPRGPAATPRARGRR